MERILAGREFLAAVYSFADIAFYMAQLFGARKGAPMTSETPSLLAWRARMTARPAVRKVAGAMAAYLVSIELLAKLQQRTELLALKSGETP
jgi:glutathione S-transferase